MLQAYTHNIFRGPALHGALLTCIANQLNCGQGRAAGTGTGTGTGTWAGSGGNGKGVGIGIGEKCGHAVRASLRQSMSVLHLLLNFVHTSWLQVGWVKC